MRVILDPDVPYPITATVLCGESLVDQGTIGLVFQAEKAPRLGKRVRAISVQDLFSNSKLPPNLREAFLKSASVMAPNGRVPGKVAKIFLDYCKKEICGPEVLAETGLARAYQADGHGMGRRNRLDCGRNTLEWRSRASDGSANRSFFRLRCKSHRCRRCAAWEVAAWRNRVNAQIDRDADAGRPRPVMYTLTLAPTVGANNAEAVKLIFNYWENFVRRLRRQWGKDLAYVLVLEAHGNGRPHAQGLIRCEALAKALTAPTSDSANRADDDFQAHATASGFGRSWVQIAMSTAAAVRDTFKTDQIIRDLPRGTHRIRASGREGNGKPGSFFLDAPASDRHFNADVDPPEGLPAFPDLEPRGRGGDAPPSQAEHRVRVQRVRVGPFGPRMELEVVSSGDHCGARFRTEFPSRSPSSLQDIASAVKACGGAPEVPGVRPDPIRTLKALVGLEARVLFERQGRTNPWTGKRVRLGGVWRWLEPGEVAPVKLEGVRVEQTAPDGPLDPAVLGGQRPEWQRRWPRSQLRTSDILIHHATVEEVVEATHGLDPTCRVEDPGPKDFEKVRTPEGVAFNQCMEVRELPLDRSDEKTVHRDWLAFYEMLAIARPAWVRGSELSLATEAVKLRLAILHWTWNDRTGTD